MINKIDLLIEECSELIQACCKVKRLLTNDSTLRNSEEEIKENMREELVDVYLVILQLKDYYFDNDEDFYTELAKKIYRLESLK